MKIFMKYTFVLIVFLLGVSLSAKAQLAVAPPMGWNSFDSYGVYLYEDAAFNNLRELAKYKKYGYKYFVIDAGWFGEFKLYKGTVYPAEKHAQVLNINEYGLLQPSKCYFPNGFQDLIDECHAKGLKFGLHLMRGIPRQAVKSKLLVKGTKYTAADIADTSSVCVWNHQNYGVDMSKPGAQEFYNSLVQQMADWGVDFLKYDDLVEFPDEIAAIAKAIENCGRPILFSISPGGDADIRKLETYQKANMLRITADIWDTQHSIDSSFKAMKKWAGYAKAGFWPDLDMIPFGKLMLMSPPDLVIKGDKNARAFAGRGTTRISQLSKTQKETFITQRAIFCSPLMMGGEMSSLDKHSKKLLTNKEMIACNQNGIQGNLIYDDGVFEIWKKGSKGKEGWIAIFNRTGQSINVQASPEKLGFEKEDKVVLKQIWKKHAIRIDKNQFEVISIAPHGVCFAKYKAFMIK